MLTKLTDDELRELPKYDRIAIYLFRKLTHGMTRETLPDELFFDLDDVRAAMRAAVKDGIIDNEVKNAADIKYTYDARRNLPSEMEQGGHITWLQVKKGAYKFKKTKRPNLVDFPGDLVEEPKIEVVIDQSPAWMAPLMGNDEQATFTLIRNAGVLQDFLGFKATPIQGHHRTTVSYGQIEIDEVQAGIDKGVPTIVPITGKGGQDRLSWSQALNLNTYGTEKAPVKNLAVRSLGVWRDDDETIWIIEFSPHTDIDQITIVGVKRLRFVLQI